MFFFTQGNGSSGSSGAFGPAFTSYTILLSEFDLDHLFAIRVSVGRPTGTDFSFRTGHLLFLPIYLKVLSSKALLSFCLPLIVRPGRAQ